MNKKVTHIFTIKRSLISASFKESFSNKRNLVVLNKDKTMSVMLHFTQRSLLTPHAVVKQLLKEVIFLKVI
jgi:hypothetical protein